MKNTHVLPTEKPSYLYQIGNDLTLSVVNSIHQHNIGRHIYITSDEEIKEGDYFIGFAVTDKKPYISCASEYKARKEDKGKIILTTDQDLIKDSVQTIDDDFLEWFVKNPSCEFVEFDYRYDTNLQPILDSFGNKVLRIKIPTKSENLSQIIIPKEEAKQETLEEVAERILADNIDGLRNALNDDDLFFFYKGVIKCYGEEMAKFQKEQDKNKYSEEDLKDAYMEGGDCDTQYKTFQEWFEQEKKK